MPNYWAYLSSADNLAVGATIAASSEDANYPLANLTALPISKAFRFTGDTSENWQIDLGSAKAISLVALVNHNLSNAAVITLNGGSSANPDGSQFTTTIAWREFDAFKLFIAETWRYWKIILADPHSPAGAIESGYLLMGEATEPAWNFAYGGWQFSDDFRNLGDESEMGVPHVFELFNRVRMSLFFRLRDADAPTLRAFFRSLKRNLTPMFLIPERESNDGYFGRITNTLSRQIYTEYQEATLEFQEDSRGRSVSA